MAEYTINRTDNTKLRNGNVLNVITDTPSKMVAYYFNTFSQHAIDIQNQITDNYLESNVAVQDHIAHSPLTISLSGLSGEVVYTQEQTQRDYEKELLKAETYSNINLASNKLAALNILLPSVSNVTQRAKNAYDYIEASANRYIGIVKQFGNSNNPLDTYNGNNDTFKETRLQEIYRKLKSLSDNNTALWVNTPYGDFTDMYIQSITLRQGEANFITDIEITLKQLRFANITTTGVDKDRMALYNAQARADVQNNGKTQSQTEQTSLLYSFRHRT